MQQQKLIHTAALLPLDVRLAVETLAKRMDRSLSAQMRQLTLLGLEQLGELPPKFTGEVQQHDHANGAAI